MNNNNNQITTTTTPPQKKKKKKNEKKKKKKKMTHSWQKINIKRYEIVSLRWNFLFDNTENMYRRCPGRATITKHSLLMIPRGGVNKLCELTCTCMMHNPHGTNQGKTKELSPSIPKEVITTQLAFYVNLHRAVIGPSATLTGRWRPDIDLRRMLTGNMLDRTHQRQHQENG